MNYRSCWLLCSPLILETYFFSYDNSCFICLEHKWFCFRMCYTWKVCQLSAVQHCPHKGRAIPVCNQTMVSCEERVGGLCGLVHRVSGVSLPVRGEDRERTGPGAAVSLNNTPRNLFLLGPVHPPHSLSQTPGFPQAIIII